MKDISKQISKGSNSSFYYAFNLLPAEKRNAMNTVYAFCRKTDDIVDEGLDSEDIKYEKLRKWRIELEKAVLRAILYLISLRQLSVILTFLSNLSLSL